MRCSERDRSDRGPAEPRIRNAHARGHTSAWTFRPRGSRRDRSKVLTDEGYIGSLPPRRGEGPSAAARRPEVRPRRRADRHRPRARLAPGPPRVLLRPRRFPEVLGGLGHLDPLDVAGHHDRPRGARGALGGEILCNVWYGRSDRVAHRKKPDARSPRGSKCHGRTGQVVRVKGPKGELTQPHPAGHHGRAVEAGRGLDRARSSDEPQQRALPRPCAQPRRQRRQGRDRRASPRSSTSSASATRRRSRASRSSSRSATRIRSSFPIPEGISDRGRREGGQVTVTGVDRQKVGQVAAEIRKLRKPDPYKRRASSTPAK